MLEESKNKSKGDEPLATRAKANKKTSLDLYVEDTTSLESKDFEEFTKVRRTELAKKLKAVLAV